MKEDEVKIAIGELYSCMKKEVNSWAETNEILLDSPLDLSISRSIMIRAV